MEELKKLYDVLVREGYYTNSFEDFQNKWQDENYRSKVFGVVSRDKLYTKDEASFNEKYQSTKAPSTWYGVPKEAQVGGSAPDEMSNLQESFKKKEQPVTTELPSADGSSVPSAEPTKPIETLKNIPTKIPTPQDLPQGQGKPFEFDLTKPKPIAKEMPKTAIQKADDLITGILSEPVKGVLQFADNVLNSEKRALKDAGFFDEEIPDTNTPISDALQRKLAETKPKGTSPLDITGNLKNIVQKIINSSLSQENKNKAIKALEVVSNQTKGVISDLERYQKENLPEDNLIVDVTRGIAGMAPDLLIAAAMKNPAAAESRFAQLAEKATAKSSSFVKKVAPKAAKVLERSIKSPFTKIMAVKEGVKAMAEAKEDENPYWQAVKGSIEGAGEGMYMNVLGEAAGKVATPLARKISQSGLNSAIATTIATPLANAGVFTTAKALRTAALEQRLITPREAAMEAGTGIGFSLLHLGSQYKNQKELNHYYDNVLNDNAAHALGRVLNETKDNLDVAYNPDLTPEQVKELIDARDELKKAILKEPDMEKKQLLGAEAVKIQNQLDAHNTIADIVQNKDFIVDQLSKQENLTPEQRAFFANKILAIADAYDMSDFAVKKRELNAKIDEAQKKLDESGNVFSNLKNASDRIYAQQEVDRRRQELEDLNAQLTELIINKTNQDAIQKQKSDETLLRAGEQRLGLRQVGEGDTQLEITPEQEKLVSDERAYYQEILDNAKDYAEEDVQDAKDYFENPIAFQEKAVKFWEDLVKEDPTEQATLDFVKSRLEAHKAAEAKPEEIQPIQVSDIEAKKADIENRRINEIGLQPLRTFASSKEQYEKDLAAWEKNKKEVDAKYDAELAAEAKPEEIQPIEVSDIEAKKADIEKRKEEAKQSIVFMGGATPLAKDIMGNDGAYMVFANENNKNKFRELWNIEGATKQDVIDKINAFYDAKLKSLEAQPEPITVKAGEGITATTTTGKPTSVTGGEGTQTMTSGTDVIKIKKNEDNEHTVTLNGKEIGKMYYDPSQKTWQNANFNRSGISPSKDTFKWVYGDILGESKQEAIDELIKRSKESKKEEPQKEEPQKVQFTKDNILNRFLNKLNELNPLKRNPIDNRSFIYNDNAFLEFNRFDKGDKNEVSIQSISSIDKGKGEGKAAMKDITDAADALGVKLTLDAKPFGDNGLTKKHLVDFYKKNGFKIDFEDAYGGEFKSEQELLDYALQHESEAIPMSREPKPIEVKAGEGITATTTTGKPTSVTMAELPETKTAGVDVKSLPDYEKTMANVEFEVPKSKEYVEKDLKKAKERYKINKTEANKAKLDKAKADYEEYKADVEKAKERAKNGLTESATYKAADDIQKEALMRELAKKFGEKQPTAPKPEELFGNVAETAKIMEELNFLFDDANKSKDFLDEKYRKAKEALDANPTSEKLKENLRKAKAEVEEYKTKNIDEAIAKLKESESYKNASAEQQARMEKYLTDKFLKSQTSKILPTKLFEGAKDIKKVTITEKKRWADQLKAFVRGAKNTVEATKTMMSEIKSAISELSKKGSITSKQAETIINKMASLKVSNEKGINKFIDYVSKVFADAEYGSKLSKAIETRSSISKLSRVKGKDPNLVILAKNFMAIKPSMVEDIDAYNDMASKIKESLRGTKVGGKEEPLKVAEMVKISEANKYVDEQIEAQNQKLYDEKLAEMNELFDTDLTGATFEQLLELARSDKPIDKEKETIIRDAIKKVFDMNSAIIKHIIEKGEDPFTGEKIDLSKEDIDLVKKFMGMDLNKLDIKDGIEAIDKLANFLQNGSIGNMESIIRSYQARENIDELNKKGLVAKPLKFYGSGLLGRTLGEQMATLPNLLENMFKGFRRSSEFEKMSGITELKNAKTFVQAMSTKMGNDYTKEFYERKANNKNFTDASNVAERGLIAALKRTISGTAEQQQAEFNRKKGLVEQSIDELKTGTEKEQELAKIYEDVYNKTLKDSKNIDEVISKSDKNNVEAVDWWINKWSEVYDQLATVSESVYNKVLDKDLFYTPDRFSRLFEKEDVKTEAQLDESLFHHNTGTVYKKETGVLQKSQKPSELPKNENGEAKRYLDLSFDKNNVNSMYDALMDIHTAGVIRQIETFFKSPGIKKIIPTAEDRAILYNKENNGRVQDFIRAARNKEIVYSDEAAKALRKLNTWSSIGTASALGSIGGIFKQTIPVAANTLINAGNIDLGYFLTNKADFLNRTGYGISIRGLESQAQISSINKLVDLASKSTGAKALEYIEKANRLWLDTFLKNPDVFIAKASWMSYYEKALKEQGTEPSTIDYSKHEVNKDAADYAQKMVDRQQNISDTDLQGKLLGSKNVKQRFIISTLMPFASFRVNQFMRAKSDIATITSKDPLVTKEDRKIAALSLSGYAAEMLVFKLIATKISTWIGDFTNTLLGKKESDEDRKKRVDNLVRGQLTGTITDVFSPIPTHLVDLGYAKGADFVLDKIQDLEGIEDKDKYKLMTSMKANELQSLGTIGIGIDKFRNYLEAKSLSETGEFTDEYGRKKYISQKDKEAMKMIAKISFLSNFGLLPAEANTISRNAVKFVKKDASSKEGGKSEEDIQMDEQYKEQRELSKEEKQQVREQKASILQQLVSEEQDSEKADIMDRKIKEYLMTDEERIKYNEDTKSERFREKQRLKELLGEYDSKSDMKKYDPALYEERFGEGSDWYNEHEKEQEVDKQVEELMTQLEEEKYGYSGGSGGGFGKPTFGGKQTKEKPKRVTERRSFSFGSRTSNNQ